MTDNRSQPEEPSTSPGGKRIPTRHAEASQKGRSEHLVDFALRRIVVGVVVALLVLVGATSTWSIIKLYSAPTFWTDFTGDYASANASLDHVDPYASTLTLEHRYVSPVGSPPELVTVNPHTPTNVAMVIPIARLPYSTARTIWLTFMATSLAAAVALCLRELGVRWVWAAGFGVACLWLRISRYALLTGQVDGILTLLVVLGWIAARRGRERSTGLALGAAAALKLFPLFLVIPLIRTRQWRAIKWQISTAATLTLLGVGALGWHASWKWATYASPHDVRVWAGAPHNLSLFALPMRWLTANSWRPEALHLHSLAILLSAGFLVVTFVGAWRSPARVSADPFLASLTWMMLAAPLSWPNELTIVLPVLAATVVRWGRQGFTRRPWPLLFGAIVLLGSPHGFLNAPISAPAQIFIWGAPFLALVGLAVGEWVHPPSANRETITNVIGTGFSKVVNAQHPAPTIERASTDPTPG